MKKEIIEDALLSTLSLLNSEVECVIVDDLKNEYLIVIEKVEIAIKELVTIQYLPIMKLHEVSRMGSVLV